MQSAAAWRLALPRTPIGGRLGDRLGSGVGSSLEFQDHRPYAPGDDLRHVDWTAYARSDVLSIRLYREEVAPRIDLVLDASRSMAVTDGKHRAYAELAALLACACASSGADTRVITSTKAAPAPLRRPADVERFLECDAVMAAPELPALPLRRRSLRVVVSDFLFPHDAEMLVRRLARDGASLALVQITSKDEAEPEIEGGRRLVDAEGHGELDVTIDAQAVQAYRARFARLRLGLSRAARRAGAQFAHVIAGTPLREAGKALAAAGVLEPR